MHFIKKLIEALTPPNANLTLNVRKNTYFLGEDIEGELTLTPNEDFDVNEVRCVLICFESVKLQRIAYDPLSRRLVRLEDWDTAILYSVEPVLSGPLHVSRGSPCRFPFRINVPITMRPTYKGVDRIVVWQISGVVAVKERPSVKSGVIEIQVAQPSDTPVIKEREMVREIIMIPCKYCGALVPQTSSMCPNCGAKRTG